MEKFTSENNPGKFQQENKSIIKTKKLYEASKSYILSKDMELLKKNHQTRNIIFEQLYLIMFNAITNYVVV